MGVMIKAIVTQAILASYLMRPVFVRKLVLGKAIALKVMSVRM
jgi:hypothetical protein